MHWIKKQSYDSSYELIKARETDDIKDFVMDPAGYYVLIKILKDSSEIALAVSTKDHKIIKEIRGRTARDVWTALFLAEKKSGNEWFHRKDHIAYIGKELIKAESALSNHQLTYVQE